MSEGLKQQLDLWGELYRQQLLECGWKEDTNSGYWETPSGVRYSELEAFALATRMLHDIKYPGAGF